MAPGLLKGKPQPTYEHACTYLGTMKTKLTLSISAARVRRVKSYSLRRKKSVSKLFEEFIDGLDVKQAKSAKDKPRKKYKLDEFTGILTGKITQADLDADPRLAHIYRKGL